MKAKDLNKSSAKTKALIKNEFVVMLSEKKEISKITITELAKRANINRSTFYLHYDDIYSIAEDYENELITAFFDNEKMFNINNIDLFLNKIYEYLSKNHNNYVMLCKSNEVLISLSKLTRIFTNKLLELAMNEPLIKNKNFIDIEIKIFVEGFMFEYVKYCRNITNYTPEYLFSYTKSWVESFINKRKEC